MRMHLWGWKTHLNELYKEKCELNQVIKDNTRDAKLKMIPIVIHKYFGYPMYEITVRWNNYKKMSRLL